MAINTVGPFVCTFRNGFKLYHLIEVKPLLSLDIYKSNTQKARRARGLEKERWLPFQHCINDYQLHLVFVPYKLNIDYITL
jgi:hypothetical protein